jgi:hypothetical protein
MKKLYILILLVITMQASAQTKYTAIKTGDGLYSHAIGFPLYNKFRNVNLPVEITDKQLIINGKIKESFKVYRLMYRDKDGDMTTEDYTCFDNKGEVCSFRIYRSMMYTFLEVYYLSTNKTKIYKLIPSLIP